MLLLAAAGCVGGTGGGRLPAPPGFSADTFGREGLETGAVATEQGCRTLPDGVWVSTADGRRHECLRQAKAGFDALRAGPATALVYIPGDPAGASYRVVGGRAQVEGVSELYELSPETRSVAAEMISRAMGGLPVVLLARPGMHGSSGNHARDRHTRDEVELLDAVLTELRRRHSMLSGFAVVGFSSGGTIAANLLLRRTDIRCAVLASAPLDLDGFYQPSRGPGAGGIGTSALDDLTMRGDLADPMRDIVSAAVRTDVDVFVVGDRQDRSVSAAGWNRWADAARRAGFRVLVTDIAGQDLGELGTGLGTRHQTSSRALEAGYACARGMQATQVQRDLLSDTPIIRPSGKRLDGAQVRAAFAGRLLRVTEWHPRANMLSAWGVDGELQYFALRHPSRRIATLRWWLQGDQLCTSRRSCGQVLSDGAYLHLFTGEPPRLAATFLPAERRAGGPTVHGAPPRL